MSGWSRRVRPPVGPRELRDVQTAAEDLAQRAGRVPGRARVVFQTVADVALIGTVLISGALAAVHLYRALLPRHKGNDQYANPEPAAHDGREPPHRRHRAVATGDDADGRGRSRGG